MSLAQDSSELARSMPKGESTGHRWWPWVAGIVAIGVGVSLLFPTARHQWALSVVRQPTPYTTLSFVHAVALPTAVPTEGEVSFSFTIANNEGRDMTYHYVVSSADRTANQATAILQRGTLHLREGPQGDGLGGGATGLLDGDLSGGRVARRAERVHRLPGAQRRCVELGSRMTSQR